MGVCLRSLSFSSCIGSSLKSSLVPTRMIGVPGAIFFFEPEINDNIFLDVSIATYNGVGFQDTTNSQARQRSPSSHINQSL